MGTDTGMISVELLRDLILEGLEEAAAVSPPPPSATALEDRVTLRREVMRDLPALVERLNGVDGDDEDAIRQIMDAHLRAAVRRCMATLDDDHGDEAGGPRSA